MEKLTEDVLINIFIRLPAKQLFQMRSVCKPWNAYLRVSAKSSYFIKSHLNHSIRNKHNNEIVLFLNPALFGKRHIHDSEHVLPCTAYDISQSPIIKLNDPVKLPRNFSLSALNGYDGHVIGSVNGLICFSIGLSDRYVEGIYIWNPSLSVVMTLPLPSVHLGDYRISFSFGFGFDPKTDDYKVVKLTDDCEDLECEGGPVEVYSMKKGEFIADKFPSNVGIEGDGRVVDDHDGHLHWLCSYFNDEDDYELQTIVAFDLGVESSFRHISLPDSIAYGENVLGMLEGKLCVMPYTQDDGKFEVWVMNECGVARDSWVKSHVLSKLRGYEVTIPIGFTLNNKFLFYDRSKGLLGCYDQETDKVTPILFG